MASQQFSEIIYFIPLIFIILKQIVGYLFLRKTDWIDVGFSLYVLPIILSFFFLGIGDGMFLPFFILLILSMFILSVGAASVYSPKYFRGVLVVSIIITIAEYIMLLSL